MKYQCEACGVFLDRPITVSHTERVGDWTRTYTEDVCPVCGVADCLTKADDCECGRPKAAAERLCGTCTESLKERVCAFFDALTADEEEQFDDWMDGDTITNRRTW